MSTSDTPPVCGENKGDGQSDSSGGRWHALMMCQNPAWRTSCSSHCGMSDSVTWRPLDARPPCWVSSPPPAFRCLKAPSSRVETLAQVGDGPLLDEVAAEL